MTTAAFISLLVAINAICIFIDKLLLNNDKEKVKVILTNLASKLKDIRPINAPRKALFFFETTIKYFFGASYYRSLKFWIFVSVISFLFTTQAIPLSNYLKGAKHYDAFFLTKDYHGFYLLFLILLNLVLDLLVWGVFILSLKTYDFNKNRWQSLKFSAFALFLLFLAAEKRYGVFYALYEKDWSYKYFVLGHHFFYKEAYPQLLIEMFGAFLPVILFLVLAISLFILIPFIQFSIWISNRLVSGLIEQPVDKLAPFTLIGTVVTVFSAVIKFISDYKNGT